MTPTQLILIALIICVIVVLIYCSNDSFLPESQMENKLSSNLKFNQLIPNIKNILPEFIRSSENYCGPSPLPAYGVSEDYITDKYVPEDYVTDKYVSDKYIADKYITDKYITDKYITDKYIADKYITDKYVSDKYVTTKADQYVSMMENCCGSRTPLAEDFIESPNKKPQNLTDEQLHEIKQEQFEEKFVSENRELFGNSTSEYNLQGEFSPAVNSSEYFGANPLDKITDMDFRETEFSSRNMEP